MKSSLRASLRESLKNSLRLYTVELNKEFQNTRATELSYRNSLQNLLNEFIKNSSDKKTFQISQEISITQSNTISSIRRPDFTIFNQTGETVVGYIETKKPDTDLHSLLKSEQIQKYQALCDNLILSDYLNFIWIPPKDIDIDIEEEKKERQKEVSLLSIQEKKDGKKEIVLNPEKIEAWIELLREFFETEIPTILSAQDLAMRLSEKARILKTECYEILKKDETSPSDSVQKIQSMYKSLKKLLFPTLSLIDFADYYAQTVVYTSFLGFLNVKREEGLSSSEISLELLFGRIPKNFPLIRDFFQHIQSFPDSILWIMERVLAVFEAVHWESFLRSFRFHSSRKQSEEDPYIYFYEDFLKAYNPNERKIRGVFYTPRAVVQFIVLAIEELLKEDLGKGSESWLDEEVTVLDFAVGTGSFLLELFSRALVQGRESEKKIGKLLTQERMRKRFLENSYGFELLLAPYVLAQLKLSEFLKENHYDLKAEDRVKVYLTNTLIQFDPEPELFVPAISRQAEEANRIKEEPVLVILGNPPYSYDSANKKTFLDRELRERYYFVDGQPLGEKNPKALQDDYVKFLCFAQQKMEQVDQGVVGVITNHNYLDAVTFRGMRESLMETFSKIYILDLHGNTRKKERSPDGSKDENVFDIMQGVSIALLVRNKNDKESEVYHSELYGHRRAKFQTLDEMSFQKIRWTKLKPKSPYYFFIPTKQETKEQAKKEEEYNQFWSVKDIFRISSVGITTARDSLCIQFTKERIEEIIEDFQRLDPERAREKYRLGEDTRDWKVELAQKDLKKKDGTIQKVLYRPFDHRYTYYTSRSRGFLCMPRGDVMTHMLNRENLGLITTRQHTTPTWQHVWISDTLIEMCSISNLGREGNYFFPLYLYEDEGSRGVENFSPEFRKFIDGLYPESYSPEEILGYIYAILHSPSYRDEYSFYLRYDFPRIPFTKDHKTFERLSERGEELIDLHLFKKPFDEYSCQFHGTNDLVEKVEFEQERLYINSESYFAPVSKEAYSFSIGGYKVLDKWLKERKKRRLSLTEIEHVSKIYEVLKRTKYMMQEINTFNFLIPMKQEGRSKEIRLQGTRSEESRSKEIRLQETRSEETRSEEEYNQFWSVKDIFQISSVGITTARDSLCIQFTKERIEEIVEDFQRLDPERAREKYHLGKDTQEWKVELAQKDLKKKDGTIQKVLYRPFDTRYTYYTGRSNGFQGRPRREVMTHMLNRENLGLITTRQHTTPTWKHAWVSDTLIEMCSISNLGREGNYLFPLHLYVDEGLRRVENFSTEFRKFIDGLYPESYSPEEILGYIYAVLHSTSYRDQYSFYLRYDFPRIPFTKDHKTFERLSERGEELIDLHLFKKPFDEYSCQFHGTNDLVEKVEFEQERLYINSESYFAPVSEEAYSFSIGGYKVLDKWLKERKKRRLSLTEIEHFSKIYEVLKRTKYMMQEIDTFNFFIPVNQESRSKEIRSEEEYNQFWSVKDIFRISSVGITTARDSLCIQFTKERMEEIVEDFQRLDPERAREKYRLGKDTRDWKVELAQKDLKKKDGTIQKVLYRPFDHRYTYYTSRSRGFLCMPRGDVMTHMLNRENFGLVVNRNTKVKEINSFFITSVMMEGHLVDNQAYLFPLYLYADEESRGVENISPEFRKFIDGLYPEPYSPEEILGYIYAILHSPSYRDQYSFYLRYDFPRIPFTKDHKTFERLSERGEELIDLHLIKKPFDEYSCQFHGTNDSVEKVEFEQERLYINSESYFAPVSEEAYSFSIGGYKVLDKWLKERKKRRLSLTEIEHFSKVYEVLKRTKYMMQEIKLLTQNWME